MNTCCSRQPHVEINFSHVSLHRRLLNCCAFSSLGRIPLLRHLTNSLLVYPSCKYLNQTIFSLVYSSLISLQSHHLWFPHPLDRNPVEVMGSSGCINQCYQWKSTVDGHSWSITVQISSTNSQVQQSHPMYGLPEDHILDVTSEISTCVREMMVHG